MKTKINLKGDFPKVCVDCEVELNPGVNVYLSMFNVGGYKCKSCKKKQSKVEHVKYWQMPAYIERKAKYIAEYHKQEGAGVYAIYEKDEVIYIGESSQIQQRVTSHFSKHINKDHWQSPIPEQLAKGKIDRKDLYFEVLEREDDDLTRQSRETYYLDKHFDENGAYPKFNTYKTNTTR